MEREVGNVMCCVRVCVCVFVCVCEGWRVIRLWARPRENRTPTGSDPVRRFRCRDPRHNRRGRDLRGGRPCATPRGDTETTHDSDGPGSHRTSRAWRHHSVSAFGS